MLFKFIVLVCMYLNDVLEPFYLGRFNVLFNWRRIAPCLYCLYCLYSNRCLTLSSLPPSAVRERADEPDGPVRPRGVRGQEGQVQEQL